MLRIRHVLWEKHMRQADLARKAKLNTASVSRICNGKEPAYSQRATRIAEALGWEGNPAELFEEVEE